MEKPWDKQQDERIFALDIGTRSIIGIVGRPEGDLFHVEAFRRLEHPRRAMIDGQIEDIDQVARVAGEVKRQLEEQLGAPLTKVAVAAAGRALKTRQASASLPLHGEYVTAQMAYELEQSAVNEARAGLDTSGENVRYFCVGHSVVQYRIDDYPFTSIYDHRGERVEADVIATFLPAEVVGSLRRCMEMIELEVDTLTLEPIAAMRAVLPPDVRLLNLALIDIGAGTADIALTRDGAVSGYTMATVAGDEITEAVIRKFLVDFSTAEAIKLAAGGSETITYKDILGHEHHCEPEDVIKAIDISVEMLAKVISDRVLEANEGPPAAAFLVGGGANTPELAARLADKIGLEDERVGIAGTNFSGRVLQENSGLDAPEYATPVGIALVAADQLASGAATVLVNGHRVRLFGDQNASVMDALLIAGHGYSELMGRNGRSLTFTLNGTRKVLRGGAYSVAEVTLNEKTASLTSPVANGDIIAMEPATSGEDAVAVIADFSEGATGFYLTLNGHRVGAGLVAYLNGNPAAPDNEINELDEVEIQIIDTVGALCRLMGYAPEAMALAVNQIPATPDTPLHEGDRVEAKSAGAAGDEPLPVPPRATIPPAVLPAAEMLPNEDTIKAGKAPDADDAIEDKAFAAEAAEPIAPPDTADVIPEAPVPQAPAPRRFPSVLDRRGDAPPAGEPVSADVEQTPAVQDLPPEPRTGPSGQGTSAAEPVIRADAIDDAAGDDTHGASEPPKPAEENTAEKANPAPPAAAPEPDEAPVPASPAPSPGGRLQIELNGKNLVLPPKPGADPHTVIDLLPLIDIDPAHPKGKLVLEVNKKEAGYLDALHSDDTVVIGWQE